MGRHAADPLGYCPIKPIKRQLFTDSLVFVKDKDDSTLIRDCLQGNNGAYEELVRKYQKPLFNVALRMVGNRDDAKDIVQSVFVKAYENLSACNPPSKFFSWIYRAAINEAINWVRRRGRQVVLTETMVSPEKPPDQEYLMQELTEDIDAAIGQLTIDHRVVLVLRHFAELSYRELGYILEIPEKTVKSRLFAARQQLGVFLRDRGIVEHG